MPLRGVAFLILSAWLAAPASYARGQTAPAAEPQHAISTLPAPSGPFGVGRVGYHWTDLSRPDSESNDSQRHRELMVYFWYPASRGAKNAWAAYLPGAQQMDAIPDVQSRMRRVYRSYWPLILSGEFHSHAIDEGPVENTSRKFPIVIFSHGLGTSGFNYSCLIEDLASRGYIVAAIEHTNTARAVWFPDGRVITIGSPSSGSGAGMSDGIGEGAGDVRFVLDQITEKNRDRKSFLLAGRVDLSRVAAMGHSAGAEFAARACQLDARIAACVDLDGGMVPIAALPLSPDGTKMRQPLLFLEAYHPPSQMGGLPNERIEAYYKKKVEQLKACPRGSYNVILRSEGIAHPSFTDTPLMFPGQDGMPQYSLALHNINLIERVIREFLTKTLNREKAPLLDALTPMPEIEVIPYGH